MPQLRTDLRFHAILGGHVAMTAALSGDQ